MKGKSQTFPSKVLSFIDILNVCESLKYGLSSIAIPITFLKCGEYTPDLTSPIFEPLSSIRSIDFDTLTADEQIEEMLKFQTRSGKYSTWTPPNESNIDRAARKINERNRSFRSIRNIYGC